jgi:hypothetical protein
MTESDNPGSIKFPEIKLPEGLSWQSVEAGKPDEPVFGAESHWPTKGMLWIMGTIRQVKEVEQGLKDYCQTLPGSKQLLEIITGYNIRFHGPDGDPEGAIERFANWLASEGGNHKKVDAETEQEPLVRTFMNNIEMPVTRSFSRERFIRQVLNQLMPGRS